MAKRSRGAFRRILCPIDFSRQSRSALRYADELAARSGGSLFVMFVNDPLLDTAAAAASYDMALLEQRSLAELRRFVKRAEIRTLPTLLAVSGHPGQAIQREALRLEIDLIVMGSRGLTGVAKQLFGSTTARLLKKSAIPVMVVPPLKRRAVARQRLRGWPGELAVIPIDLTDYHIADVKRALSLVGQLGASPLFIHAVPSARLPSWLRLGGRSSDGAKLAETWLEIKKAAGPLARGAGCRLVVGDPAEQIAALATAVDAGVIVLSLKKGAGALGARRGSISYQVVAKAAAPVLALPGIRRVAPGSRRQR